LLLVAVAAVVLSGCAFRPLEGELIPETALIPVHIDWSRSGVPVEQMHRASILLYPAQGGAPLEFILEGNLTSYTLEVPLGVYSVLVFNETISEDDWSGLTFINTDDYHNFSAVGRAVSSRGFYTRSDELPLIENPEPLAAWSLDRLDVTEELWARSRMTSRATLDRDIPDLMNVVPTPRIEQMAITANVRHLSSAMQATGTINGLASGVKMASGDIIDGDLAAHAFVLGSRTYDPDQRHGSASNTFTIFGHPKEITLKPMEIDFVLFDGTAFPTVSFSDVTSMIVRYAETIPPLNILEVGDGAGGNDDPNPDNPPIELPDSDIDSDITVDDWNDVVIPVK
jgi:hypothetical protein